MNKSTIWPSALIFAIVLMISQVSFNLAQVLTYQHSLQHAFQQIEVRIALDASSLDLGDPATKQIINMQRVSEYITQLNSQIASHLNMPEIKVQEIRHLYSDNSSARPHSNGLFWLDPTRLLYTDNLVIEIGLKPINLLYALSFNWLGLLIALVVCAYYMRQIQMRKLAAQQRKAALPAAKLRIDLERKQLINLVTQQAIEMQNKPLCFFTALVEYCIANPAQELLHHKDIPNELLLHANKVFARLIVLGHTKRKRPDFNANLEKTLSEIRAQLDLVFINNEPCKALFYPPRAQGEGSRSKQHSYALQNIKRADVEIIGL